MTGFVLAPKPCLGVFPLDLGFILLCYKTFIADNYYNKVLGSPCLGQIWVDFMAY